MFVVDQKHQILGSLNKNFGNVSPGDRIRIVMTGLDDYYNPSQDFFSLSSTIELSPSVVEVKRNVFIDEMQVMNLNRNRQNQTKPRKEDFLVIAAHDRQFRQLLEAGGETEITNDIVNMRIVATVRLKAILADLETSEKLFDMDEFTPA